jgi:hypothetical protein
MMMSPVTVTSIDISFKSHPGRNEQSFLYAEGRCVFFSLSEASLFCFVLFSLIFVSQNRSGDFQSMKKMLSVTVKRSCLKGLRKH